MSEKALNNNFHNASKAKEDEFYTQLSDIEKELRHYKEHFKDKVVYCNCDDPRISNFFHYFSYNFEKLGLKKLITTCYKNPSRDLFSQNNSEHAIYLEYEVDKNYNKDSGENLVKFTHKFLKKITDNLNNFSYNVIIASIHEMYSFFSKEIENEYTSDTLKENYTKILITIMPVIPHFANECLNLLNIKKNFEWPKYNFALLEENFVNVVVQINGKKRGLLKAKKNILENEILENIKKDNTIMKYLSNTEIKKKIYIPNKLINIII